MHDEKSSTSEGTSSANHGASDGVHPSEYLPDLLTVDELDRIGTQTDTTTDRIAYASDATGSKDDFLHSKSGTKPDPRDQRGLPAEAYAHTQAEHKMSFIQGCRIYPKAIAWSILLSATIIMEGFDLTLIASFQAFPVFRKTYGQPTAPGGRNHQISPAWQTALQDGAIAGEILGLFLNGWMVDRYGYQKTMVIALIWMALFVFLAFFAFNIEMLEASQVLCGVPWGIFQTLSMSYAAEIMPIALRAYLLSNVNMCWLIGQCLAVGILRGFINLTTEWSYRIPFALQWAFAVPILIGVFFAPDSPWWLVRHGRSDAAKESLLRLTSRNVEGFKVDEALSMLCHTDKVEKEHNGGMSYFDCFRGNNLRRTEIACMVWATQALCGLSLTGWAAYYYEQAGFSVANAFNLSVGMYGLAIIGGIISWGLLPRVGRRRLYIGGLIVMQLMLIAAGVIGVCVKSSAGSWAVGSLLIALTMVYDITVGPVCYVLVAEIPSTRLRVKTVVLARVVYNVASLITNILTARMLNPTAWAWGPKANFVYAGTNLFCLIWCCFRLPETMGLSYLELDILFEKRAKSKKFKEVQMNLERTGYFSLRKDSTWGGY